MINKWVKVKKNKISIEIFCVVVCDALFMRAEKKGLSLIIIRIME